MSWNDAGESLHGWPLKMGVYRREGGLRFWRGRLDPIVTCGGAPVGQTGLRCTCTWTTTAREERLKIPSASRAHPSVFRQLSAVLVRASRARTQLAKGFLGLRDLHQWLGATKPEAPDVSSGIFSRVHRVPSRSYLRVKIFAPTITRGSVKSSGD